MRIDTSVITKTLIGIKNVSYLETGGQKTVFRGQHEDYGDVVIKVIINPSVNQPPAAT